MMSEPNQLQESPRRYRWGIRFLSMLLALLFYWLLDFIVSDIGNLPGPRRDLVERQFVAQEILDELPQIERQRGELQAQIEHRQQTQRILQQSMEQSRTTMDQLIQLHRLNLEKGVVPSEAERAALAESQQLFLAKQQEFQAINEEIAELNGQLQTLDDKLRDLNRRRMEAGKRIHKEFSRQMLGHRLKVASFKLIFLMPVLLLATWLVLKRRSSRYGAIFYALLVAVFLRTILLMHQYFPRQWFKYIAVLAGIAVVLLLLVQLIRLITSSRGDWLLKQYREAYRQNCCPICNYPIPPWEDPLPERPYTCASCGTRLFDACTQCTEVRHTLLPFCESCGDERPIG